MKNSSVQHPSKKDKKIKMEKGLVTSIQMTLVRFVGHHCSEAPVPPLSLFPLSTCLPRLAAFGCDRKVRFQGGYWVPWFSKMDSTASSLLAEVEGERLRPCY